MCSDFMMVCEFESDCNYFVDTRLLYVSTLELQEGNIKLTRTMLYIIAS
jgi:hypothetical protein